MGSELPPVSTTQIRTAISCASQASTPAMKICHLQVARAVFNRLKRELAELEIPLTALEESVAKQPLLFEEPDDGGSK